MPVGVDGYELNVIDLEKYFGTVHCVAYLKTNVWIEESQKLLFELESDDGFKLWVNSELVHQKNIMRGHNQGEDIIEVNIVAGWNTILIKVTQGTGGWGASLVLTDLEQNLIQDLKYKTN